MCLNGHEWVKQQLRREGIGFESLDNGFLSCENPQRLQAICDALSPDEVQGFFDRWVERLPWPLTPADRTAGFSHRLAIWQLEVSLTQVFDHPVQGRHFFEELIRENLDLGRPDRVSLLFPTKLTKATPAPPYGYRTRVITDGVNPSLHVEHKHSHVKQYFKEERALRTETTINDPGTSHGRNRACHLEDTGGDLTNRMRWDIFVLYKITRIQVQQAATKRIDMGTFAARIQELMYILVRNFQQCDQMCLSQHGITVSQSYALMAFPHKAEITMNELSETIGVANSTMTRMVDHLVQKELVWRRQDDRDRRVVLASLTPQGQGLRSKLEREKLLIFQEVLQDIPEDQRPAILHALESVVHVFAKALESTCCTER